MHSHQGSIARGNPSNGTSADESHWADRAQDHALAQVHKDLVVHDSPSRPVRLIDIFDFGGRNKHIAILSANYIDRDIDMLAHGGLSACSLPTANGIKGCVMIFVRSVNAAIVVPVNYAARKKWYCERARCDIDQCRIVGFCKNGLMEAVIHRSPCRKVLFP